MMNTRIEATSGFEPLFVLSALISLALSAPAAGAQTLSTPVAYVGCSISTQAVHGYELEGGTRMWHPPSSFDGAGEIGVYPGGSPVMWSAALDHPEIIPYWQEFDAMQAARPARSLWWEVCVRASEPLAQSLAAAERVLTEVRRRLPGVTVYVSAVPDYEVPAAVLGADGAERAQSIADTLIARGLAATGPVMPDVLPSHLLPDATHFNEAGERAQGRALLGFFGPLRCIVRTSPRVVAA